MVTEVRLGVWIGAGGLVRGSVDVFAQGGVGGSRFVFERFFQRCDAGRDFFALFVQTSEALHGGIVRVVVHVCAVNCREHGLQRVVVLLRDGIKLVVVALRALNGERTKSADGVLHHVIAIQMPRDLAIELRLRHLRVSDVIPRPGGNETKRGDAVRGAWIEYITGDLFFDEARIGFVVVECADHIVAVGPGVVARFVLVITMRFTVVHEIEPVPCPALAVTR